MAETRSSGHLSDAWLDVDETEDPEFFVRFLDASRTRALEFARNHPEKAFAHLGLRPGLSVLDCGCGTGDMLALIAKVVAPGQACGGDLSEVMLREAQRRTEPSTANLRFQRMDVQALPFPDGSYDRVIATQLLVHVPQPQTALQEMCRVTKPKGRVTISDMDWDTLVVGSSHKDLSRRFTRLFSDGLRNGLIVRDYAGWLRAAGFVNVQVNAQALVFESWPFFREWLIQPSLPHFVALGSMTSAEASALIDDLAERSERKQFLAGASLYTVTADRP